MLSVLRQRDFALLWTAGLISWTGHWMLFIALPVTVYELTGSPAATAGILIANSIPSLVLGSVAGVFVDRWDRRRTMVVVNLVRAPILLLLLTVDSADRLWIVYVVAFATSALSQFFGPAENALLPRLVGDEYLVPANAVNALNNNLARLIGPALGGLVAAWAGLRGVAAVDAVSFFIAAALIAAIATSAKPERRREPDVHAVKALWTEWLDGLRLIRANRVLGVVFGVLALTSLGEGVMGAIFWVWVDEALDGGALEAGWLMSAQAVGGLLGAFVIGAWAKGVSPARLLGWGAIGLGAIDLVIFNYPAFLSGIWLGLLLMAIVGVPATASGTGFTTLIQTETDDAYRGRVFGALNTTTALLVIAGAALAGAVTGRLGATTVLTVQSASSVVAGLFALRMLGVWAVPRLRAKRASVPEGD
ncbi:MAG: MFS transporter [Chloroflexota bacterium]|nr:MFS transporter [Chloroflexota bacterium]